PGARRSNAPPGTCAGADVTYAQTSVSAARLRITSRIPMRKPPLVVFGPSGTGVGRSERASAGAPRKGLTSPELRIRPPRAVGRAQFVDRLEAALARRLLVATDHEGGRVIMLGAGTTIFPDSLAVGTAGEEAFAHRQGLIEARELRRLGIDLNLGPVLDVLTE